MSDAPADQFDAALKSGPRHTKLSLFLFSGGDVGSTEVVKLQWRATGTWGPPKPRLRNLNADNTFALAA